MFKKLFRKNKKGNPAERFLEHWNQLFQKEAEFVRWDSKQADVPGVTSLVYKDVPKSGMTTAITYGLSLVKHPDWKFGRPELMLTVDSTDPSWGDALAYLANGLRGDCPFSYGNTVNFQSRISESSPMDAFFVFAPAAVKKEDYVDIDIGLKYKITIAGVYPIHASELQLIQNWGLERFWKHPLFNMWDPDRPPMIP